MAPQLQEDQETALETPLGAIDDDVAEISSWRRWAILFVVCWMPLPMTFWSTAVMPVADEVASGFHVNTTTITTANAGVFIGMALSGLIWLPISTIIGRKSAYLAANTFLCICAVIVAVSPNITCFIVFWVIGGVNGPFFLVAGQTILADIFEPTVRGTAVGVFLASCVSANTIAPLVGSVIGTFTSWRIIFAVEAGMSVLGLVLSVLFIPKASEIGNAKLADAVKPKTSKERIAALNPMTVLRQYKNPRITLSNLTCGLLSCNQYGILSSVRRVVNPRFHLTSPLESGLFYLAPGAGFLLGGILGGKLSDLTVKQYKKKRNGVRRPEDRLYSSLPSLFFILPLGTLLYGWSVDRKFGGMPLTVISAFIEGVGLMSSFSALNTYAAEVNPVHRSAVITGKYVVQYSFGAIGTGITVPLIDAIHVGWTFTITASISIVGGIFVFAIAHLSQKWRNT